MKRERPPCTGHCRLRSQLRQKGSALTRTSSRVPTSATPRCTLSSRPGMRCDNEGLSVALLFTRHQGWGRAVIGTQFLVIYVPG
ncbi:hypothetical protein NDU88_003212 [Pleurodeles waltl]|uniref:Uncharacterized protein n=1 Tax=Pleurodeles waltl TaxID=8319 RepID=A0AAV7UZZ7_PLEWA|nr:hypothetical protein NDU88_003212 [Pleurodeles waltl]